MPSLVGSEMCIRDSFYVGINLGAFGGSLIAGYLGETYGWKYGFGLAGIGMLAGLIVFMWGKPLLEGAGESPNPELLKKKRFAGLSTEWLIYLGTFLATIFIWWVVRDQGTVGVLLGLAGLIVVSYILYRSVFTLKPHARNRIIAAMFLISVQVLFWGLFEQALSLIHI